MIHRCGRRGLVCRPVLPGYRRRCNGEHGIKLGDKGQYKASDNGSSGLRHGALLFDDQRRPSKPTVGANFGLHSNLLGKGHGICISWGRASRWVRTRAPLQLSGSQVASLTGRYQSELITCAQGPGASSLGRGIFDKAGVVALFIVAEIFAPQKDHQVLGLSQLGLPL